MAACRNSSPSSRPSPFLSAALNHARRSDGTVPVWAPPRVVPRTRVRAAVARRSVPQAKRIARSPLLARRSLRAPLADDLPGSVGHTTGGAEGILRPAANGYGLLELSAIPAVGLVRADRCDRSRMSAVGVGPRDRLSRRRRFERLLRGLVRQPPIALVKEVAREPTHESAADDARGDRRATTPGRRRDQAAHRRASEPADCRLRASLARFAAREYPGRQHDNGDRLQNVSTPEHPGLHGDSSRSARVLRTVLGGGLPDIQYHGRRARATKGQPTNPSCWEMGC